MEEGNRTLGLPLLEYRENFGEEHFLLPSCKPVMKLFLSIPNAQLSNSGFRKLLRIEPGEPSLEARF